MQYWLLGAEPNRYDVIGAVANLDVDTWTTQGRHLKPGDRALVWQFQGRRSRRGVVGLAEITSEPSLRPDVDNGHWRDLERRDKPMERVDIRYLRSPGLPLWLDDDPTGVLAQLSVNRAQGGAVFKVTPDQWDAIVAAAGGWPETSAPVAEGVAAVEAIARPHRGQQGFQSNIEVRLAVEQHAMTMACDHFARLGWDVDSSAARTEPFDLRCTRGGEELHVEVKGTTTLGDAVLLTAGEVRHAQTFPNVAIAVVRNIAAFEQQDSRISVSGGDLTVFHPWKLAACALQPLAYRYVIPVDRNSV